MPSRARRAPRRRRRRPPPRQPEGERPVDGAAPPAGARPPIGLRDDPPGAVVVTGGDRIFAAGAEISEFRSPEEPDRGRSPGPRPSCIGQHFLRALERRRRHPAGHDRRHRRLRPRRRVRAGAGLRLPHRQREGQARPARDPARHHPRRRRHPAPGPAGRPGSGQGPHLHRPPGPGRRGARHRARRRGRAPRGGARPRPGAGGRARRRRRRRPGPRQAGHRPRASTSRLNGGLDLEQQLFAEVFATDDANIGVQSFLESGPGNATFTGR